MIVHTLTQDQEHDLRLAYVKSGKYNPDSWDGYKNFAIDTTPGVVDALYKNGDESSWMASLVFDNEASLMWYLLRYA